jgi:hypothetical protein
MNIPSPVLCLTVIRKFSFLASFLAILSIPALAGVTVNSPVDKTQVGSPFKLSAFSSGCSSQSISSMGYSFDSSSDAAIVHSSSIDSSVDSPSGTHTLHVKAWGNKGAVCVTDVVITVGGVGGTEIPSNAVTASNIQAMSNWEAEHDRGGAGDSNGSMEIVGSPSLQGGTRRFVTQYSNSGDERYSVTYADDTNATNFFYDAWVYLTSSADGIGNLEMDTNQVMPNGKTAIFGVQCDGYAGAWAYTANMGTAEKEKPQWLVAKGTKCNPRDWSRYTWHHVQASYSRDDSGWITYHSAWLDGVESQLNATVYGAFDLGWDPAINTQFQVDGLGSSGHSTVYLDGLTISRW